MKKTTSIVLLVSVAFLVGTWFKAVSQENPPAPKNLISATSFEYASVRFMEEKTSIVWPDGTVQNVIELNGKKKFAGGENYPKGADYRMYWLTVSMNIMAQRGFELAYMQDHDVVMKKQIVGK